MTSGMSEAGLQVDHERRRNLSGIGATSGLLGGILGLPVAHLTTQTAGGVGNPLSKVVRLSFHPFSFAFLALRRSCLARILSNVTCPGGDV